MSEREANAYLIESAEEMCRHDPSSWNELFDLKK